jgi:signal transduction histidine kinase
MIRRSVVLYWLLLLVPTLVLSVAVFRLLSREQQRIVHEAASSAQERARAIAEGLLVTIETVEENLTEAMRDIPPERELDTLLVWERENPLVRNVFLWRPLKGLAYPESGRGATAEEKRFASRFEGLFSGRVPWWSEEAETPIGQTPAVSNQAPSPPTPAQSEPSQLVQGLRKLRSGGKQLEQLVPAKSKRTDSRDSDGSQRPQERAGWLPWFSENRLHLLGWVRRDGSGLVYGMELELMALLSRLVGDFPDSSSEGVSYALVDGEGRILLQSGVNAVDSRAKPDITVSLAPGLPHWAVAVYFTGAGMPGQSGKRFMILSGLLLAMFVVAIVTGATLLTWQAHRNMLDARQKTGFVSNVSHELKTPLTSIRMYAELLAENRIDDEQKKKRYLQVIVSESQRLTRLVNNVLDFSRLEQGRKTYHVEEVELTEHLSGIVEAQRLRIRDAGMELTVRIPHTPVYVRTDRDALEQVALNLIDNAVKYAAEGKELLLALELGDMLCTFRLADRGPGIPAGHRARIFDKFHRVDSSLTARQQGAGLGLSISRMLARDLGGDLVYEPRPGGGSSFTVTMPLGGHGGRLGEQQQEHRE